MKTETRHIKTLAELREAKRELRMKIALADRNSRQSFLFSSASKLFNRIEDSSSIQQSGLGQNVYSALNLVSEKANEKFQLGKTAKTLISIAILVSAPIIAKKIQDIIDDYR